MSRRILSKGEFCPGGFCPRTFLQTGDGAELKNSVFQQFLKDNDIKFFTTKSEKKASIVGKI